MKENKPYVLIVDDEPDLREVWRLLFEERGHNFIEAKDGDEAVEILKSRPVDILITDLKMPNSNGLFLLDYIKNHVKNELLQIVCSGFIHGFEKELKNYDLDYVIEKPYDAVAEFEIILEQYKDLKKSA